MRTGHEKVALGEDLPQDVVTVYTVTISDSATGEAYDASEAGRKLNLKKAKLDWKLSLEYTVRSRPSGEEASFAILPKLTPKSEFNVSHDLAGDPAKEDPGFLPIRHFMVAGKRYTMAGRMELIDTRSSVELPSTKERVPCFRLGITVVFLPETHTVRTMRNVLDSAPGAYTVRPQEILEVLNQLSEETESDSVARLNEKLKGQLRAYSLVYGQGGGIIGGHYKVTMDGSVFRAYKKSVVFSDEDPTKLTSFTFGVPGMEVRSAQVPQDEEVEVLKELKEVDQPIGK